MSTAYLQGLLQTTAMISPAGVASVVSKGPKFSLTQPPVIQVGPTLKALTLSTSAVNENSPAGTVVGQILNTTTGSLITMGVGADGGGRFTVSNIAGSWYVVTTAISTDYETATSHSIDLVETLSGAIGNPKTTSGLTIGVVNQNDTNPNAFAFVDVTNASQDTLETSNSITIAGLGAADSATASISGDASSQMSINGGAWGAGPATVVNGDTIAVRHTSSSSTNATVSTTLTVGTTSDTFSSTTHTSAALAMGLNLQRANYYDNTFVTNDMRFGDNTKSKPSGNSIPAANMNSSHQITSMPSGDTSLSFHCRPPEAANTTVDATFTGGNVVSSLTMVNATVVAGPDYAAGTVSVIPTVNQPSSIGFVFQMTPSGATIPQLLSVKPRGSSGTLSPSSVTNFAALTTSAGPLRVMKRTGVENNDGVQMTSIAGAFPAAVITAATRNTTASQDQLINTAPGTLVNDGEPMELSIAIAQAAGRPLWRTLPWNASNDYYDAIGDLAAAAALSTGLVTYFEQSNEVWNSTYWVFNQAMYEGLSEGLTGIDGSAINSFTGSISPLASVTGNTTSGSNSITGASSIANLVNGTPISGPGIPSNTTVVSASGTTITISNNATSTASGVTLSFAASVLTVSGLTGPGLAAQMLVSGAGVTNNTKTIGGSGSTWTVYNSQTVASEAMKGGWRYTERYIEKVCQVMDRIKARYVAAGAPLSCLKRVFAWQNVALTSAFMDQVLTYAPPGYSALSNHIDVFASAPYLTQGSVSTADTTPSDFINAMYSSIDSIIDGFVATLQAKCTQYGLSPAFYEFGQSLFINDTTTRHAVQTGSDMYGVMMNAFARAAAAAPGAPLCNFVYCSPEDTSSPFASWGILYGTYQTPDSTTPKYNAQADFVAGKRKLIALTGTFGGAVNAGLSVGASLGYLKRRTPGSTITLQSNPGTAVAITDPTAQILQFTVATAAAFSSAGTVSITVRETDPRDPAGFLDTTVPITVNAVIPHLTGPLAGSTGSSTASLSVTTDTPNGTLYWILSTSATPPSVAQIQAGHDSTGSAASASGNQSVSATGAQSANASGLSSGTYYPYFQQHSASGGDSTVVAGASFVEGAWSPSSMGANLVGDFTNFAMANLYTDTAATTNVTTDGQTVKAIKDPTTGLIFTNSTGWVYHANSGKPYLAMDGTSTFSKSGLTFADTNGVWAFWFAGQVAGSSDIVDISNNRTFFCVPATNLVSYVRNSGGTLLVQENLTGTNKPAANTNQVWSRIMTATTVESFTNNVGDGATAWSGAAVQSGTFQINNPTSSTGRCYGFIIAKGDQTPQQANAQTYMSALF